jgi:hypothetical protein
VLATVSGGPLSASACRTDRRFRRSVLMCVAIGGPPRWN